MQPSQIWNKTSMFRLLVVLFLTVDMQALLLTYDAYNHSDSEKYSAEFSGDGMKSSGIKAWSRTWRGRAWGSF